MGMRTPEEKAQAKLMFEEYRKEIFRRQRINSESYDKYLLALSSSGVGVSVAFMHLFTPIHWLWLVSVVLALFFVAVILSLAAFPVSNKALDRQLEIAESYYMGEVEEAFEKSNAVEKCNITLNLLAGIIFVLALIGLVLFVARNVH